MSHGELPRKSLNKPAANITPVPTVTLQHGPNGHAVAPPEHGPNGQAIAPPELAAPVPAMVPTPEPTKIKTPEIEPHLAAALKEIRERKRYLEAEVARLQTLQQELASRQQEESELVATLDRLAQLHNKDRRATNFFRDHSDADLAAVKSDPSGMTASEIAELEDEIGRRAPKP